MWCTRRTCHNLLEIVHAVLTKMCHGIPSYAGAVLGQGCCQLAVPTCVPLLFLSLTFEVWSSGVLEGMC